MKLEPDLLDALLAESNLDGKTFSRLLKNCRNDYRKLVTLLVKEGYVSRLTYGRKIGDAMGVAYLPISDTLIQQDLLTRIPQEIAEKYSVIALYEINGVVSVAMSEPGNSLAVQEITGMINAPISIVFSFEDEIQYAISLHYITIESLEETLENVESGSIARKKGTVEELTTLAQVSEITSLLDMIIHLALKSRATDIHLEPQKHHVRLRFRNDGVLFTKSTIGLDLLPALVSRIKVLCQLDIAEKRQPQDGRFEFHLPQSSIDIRASVLPSLHGEKVVLRLLGAELFNQQLDFERLGFSPDIKELVTKALSSANGMLFVTGPTGSGKTTTLHCALNHIINTGINVVTIEDPIEYERPEITQVSIDNKAGRDFPKVLRAILRQDPDVIMIGEIRDLETARIAANAALTGHVVLTSLHTNDAVQAVTRMVEMGVEHFVIAPSIIGVLGQRLVRRICPYCKFSYRPADSELAQHFDLEGVAELPLLFKGRGCGHCNNTGYFGRLAIHEYLGISQELRNCILRGTNYEELYEIARQSDQYHNFALDGYRKALLGLTTLEEVRNAIPRMHI